MQRSKGFLAGLWCQVTGKVEAGETHWEAATREVIEETGLQPSKLYSADFCDFFYEPTSNTIEAIPIFVAIVPNDADVKLNDENTAYRWVDLLEAIDLVPFVGHRQALREIHYDFMINALWKPRSFRSGVECLAVLIIKLSVIYKICQ